MGDDAGDRILGVGVDRTTSQACRLETMVASHREIRARRLWKEATLDLSDAPPVDRRRIAVLLVAGDDTALAADALAHVDVEAVLLARSRNAIRHPRNSLPRSPPQQRHGHRRIDVTRSRRKSCERDPILGRAFHQG
jgi:hypothetical protein